MGNYGGMELCVFCEPQQGASYETLANVARVAEREGFAGFFRSDHYLKMGSVDGLPGPSDAWVTLAGLARDTERIRLGTLVTSATFRLPGPLAISVAGVDYMSGGRVELGLGAGWYEAEHRAYAIPFPPTKERFERLREQIELILGLWRTPVGQTFDFEGRYYRASDSPGLPKPLQDPHPPLIVGGSGLVRTPALAARYAQELNTPFLDPSEASRRYQAARQACEELGRDPASLKLSAAVVVCAGEDRSRFEARAKAIGRDPNELLSNGAAGTPEQVAARLRGYAEVGAERVYLQFLDLSDLEHVELVARQVAPLLT